MIRISPIFSDHMVLQKGKYISVFGTGDDGERVTVRLGEDTAGADVCGGKWRVVLRAREYETGLVMTVTCGEKAVTFSDIAVGEVWLAGGQSNMEYELRNDRHGVQELSSCAKENVRYYYTPKCSMLGDELDAAEAASHWETASETNSVAWSAVGW